MTLYNDVLFELQDYILDNTNITKSLKFRLENLKIKKQIIKNKEDDTEKIFFPIQEDTLFWIYYIIKNGFENYQMLNNKNSIIAKQFKIELISVLRKNKNIIKNYKFDTLSNIENNMVNDNKLNIKSFLTLFIIENINIIFIKNKKTYFETNFNNSTNIYIIEEIDNKFGYRIPTDLILKNIKLRLYKIDNINKPIKAFSAYKVCDLIDICNKLSIDIKNKETLKQKSKKDLYEAIIQYINY